MTFRGIRRCILNVVFLLLVLASCKKKNDSIDVTLLSQQKIVENLDSIYTIAQQVYLWNDQLPSIDHFKPRQFFKVKTEEIRLYKNEIYQITQYAKNTSTNDLYEYNLLNPKLPKYSTLISRSQSNDETTVQDYTLSNPFGISITINNNIIRLLYVDANSPAGKAGLTRGMQIVSINEKEIISKETFMEQWKLSAKLSFIKFEVFDLQRKKREVRLNASAYEQNPVFKKLVLNNAGSKIGYLAYHSFTHPENTKRYLDPIFLMFDQANISDLIIDLRYNQGGFQMSVNFLADLIVPDFADKKIMYSEHYNTLMQNGRADILKTQNLLDDNGKPAVINGKPITLYDIDYSVSANTNYFNKNGGLTNIKKVYFIVSDMTASASELLINVLRPYMNIEIIGVSRTKQTVVNTYGKPIGFFPIKLKQFDLYLSMYQLLNAQGEGNYFQGIEANRTVIDNIESDFGSYDDPAISEILHGTLQKKGNSNPNQVIMLKRPNLIYYFNTNHLEGNLKTIKDLKIKKK